MNANADGGASRLSKEFTSTKFNLLDALASDLKVKPVDFHIAYVIVQHVNQFTNLAIISDNKLQQLVHRDRKALTKARKRLVSLGWQEVRTGRYGKATEYRFCYERAKLLKNIRLDEQLLAREKGPDSGEETPHTTKPRNEAKTGHKERANNWEKTSHRPTGVKVSGTGPQWGENIPHSGDKSHPLHLQTPRDSLPVKGKVSTHAHDAHVCAYDQWSEFNEVAGRLEFEEDLPRDVAERLARTQLGFDEGGTNSRQGAGTAPLTVAKRNPEEGILDDQEHPYHG
jgi:hypothetical protein